MKTNAKLIKPIRSFVIREGRMTKGQKRALEELWHLYGLDVDNLRGASLDLETCFNRVAPTTLEIGFGDGGALFQMAKEFPERNFIGVEVHRPGVGKVLLDIHDAGLSNIKVFCEDGNGVLACGFADASLGGVNLFFPDPWHKKKHHKRRILQPQFIELIARKLVAGGCFHFASDWEPYALEALELLDDAPGLVNQAGHGLFSPRPDIRPLTKFEKRGHRLGHGVWDIMMIKKPVN
ncbi:MAG: tRNA (guanosine(46)-N7)-methyltransferase TrmB [Gammaproteobacteria bacterium]|nr:tRNA (guanosine(46)-N7)-methyltransferase TrmB [Gammaproteobacteria bacterium]